MSNPLRVFDLFDPGKPDPVLEGEVAAHHAAYPDPRSYEAALTCEYCRHAPAGALIVVDFEYSRVKAAVCEPCGKRSLPDAAKVAKAAWLFTLIPVAEARQEG